MMALSQNYLRRQDTRRRVMFSALLECRGVTQKVRVADFSPSGLRIDQTQGLAIGDPVEISLAPGLKLKGEVAWAVWHKAGMKLLKPLSEDDPAYLFLAEQANAIERARTLALVAIAKERGRD